MASHCIPISGSTLTGLGCTISGRVLFGWIVNRLVRPPYIPYLRSKYTLCSSSLCPLCSVVSPPLKLVCLLLLETIHSVVVNLLCYVVCLHIKLGVTLYRNKMPKPTCTQCSTTDSLLWRSQESGQICNECYLANAAGKDVKAETKSEDEDSRNGDNTPARATGRGARKSTRAARQKAAPPPPTPRAPPAPRGRGRRALQKRVPLRAPTATATLVTSESIFFKASVNHF